MEQYNIIKKLVENNSLGNTIYLVELKKTHNKQIMKKISISNEIDRKDYNNEVLIMNMLKKTGHKHNIICITNDFIDNTNKYGYIVMDYIENSINLFEFLTKQHNILKIDYLYIMLQMTHTIKHLHSLGIIHADIKPDNFLIINVNENNSKYSDNIEKYLAKYTENDDTQYSSQISSKNKKKINNKYIIILIDFGFSCSYISTNKTNCHYYGTTGYLAPELYLKEDNLEQLNDKHSLAFKSDTFGLKLDNYSSTLTSAIDIYALGVTIYMLLTSQYMFNSDDIKKVKETKDVNLLPDICSSSLFKSKEYGFIKSMVDPYYLVRPNINQIYEHILSLIIKKIY